MAKRDNDDGLDQDNFRNEGEPEEAGSFKKASASTVSGRKIIQKKAAGNAKHQLYDFKTQVKQPSFSTPSVYTSSTTVNPFAALSEDAMIKTPSFSFVPMDSKPSVFNLTPVKQSIAAAPAPLQKDIEKLQLAKDVRGLNFYFKKAVNSQLDQNDMVDLTEMVKEYQDFIKVIMKKSQCITTAKEDSFKSPAKLNEKTMLDQALMSVSQTPAPTTLKPNPFSSFKLAPPTTALTAVEPKSVAAPTLFGNSASTQPLSNITSFGANPFASKIVTPANFGEVQLKSPTKNNLTFGSNPFSNATSPFVTSGVAASSPMKASSLSFAVTQASRDSISIPLSIPKESPTVPAFSFAPAASKAVTAPSPTTAFSFMPAAAKPIDASLPTPAFSFALTATNPMNTSTPTLGFTFGSTAAPVNAKLSNTGFSFASTPVPLAAAPGFSFGSVPAPASFSFNPPSSQSFSKTEEQDEDRFSPEEEQEKLDQEAASVKLKDALMKGDDNTEILFEARVKLMKLDGGKWADVGLGNLYLNTMKDTGSHRVLVRADGGGRILLNAGLPKEMVVKKESPQFVAFDIVDGDGKPGRYLAKVKLPDVAEALYNGLLKYKAT